METILALTTILLPSVAYLILIWKSPKIRPIFSLLSFLLFFPLIWVLACFLFFMIMTPFFPDINTRLVGVSWGIAFALLCSLITVPFGIASIWVNFKQAKKKLKPQ